MSGSVFTADELATLYKLQPVLLPTKNDALRFVLSRTSNLAHSNHNKSGLHNIAVRELAREVAKIWNDADCCPYSVTQITRIFEKDVWDKYNYLAREKYLPGSKPLISKRSHKKDPSKPNKYSGQPRRKSSRRDGNECSASASQNEETETPTTDTSSMAESEESSALNLSANTRTQSSLETSLKLLWQEEGRKLFDVKSQEKVIRCLKKGRCFDSEFYADQQEKREYLMVITKVTKEFIEEDKKRKKTEALAERNRLSACGIVPGTTGETENENTPDVDPSDDDNDEDCMELEGNISSEFHHFNSVYYTRRKKDAGMSLTTTKNNETQTETHVPSDVSLRIMNKNGKCNLIEPRYLEGMSLLMSENLSASEAIKAVYIIDTVIWGQVRYLPLRLNKTYMKAYNKLKKLQSQSECNKSIQGSSNIAEIESESTGDMQTDILNEVELVENDSIRCVTENISVDLTEQSPELSKLIKIVNENIEERKKAPGSTLPDVSCVRHNHNLVAVYCESRIGEELVEKTGFLQPDGTSRQGVGEMAATVTKIGDKFRALKTVQITKGTSNNWANAIIYMLKRLSLASNNDIHKIWGSVSAIVSDLCKVNKNLAVEIKDLLGSSWKPGQVFCNLHFTLAIPEAIKSVLASYQTHIGADKLFPKTVGFEMNLEDKLIVIQILDCWMRLTSIRWQSRAWNRYRSFTDFAEKRSIQNVGHMLHANRFCEFEERCAGGLYLSDIWLAWLGTFTDVRNQLACYLREVEGLIEQCKFLWAGAALIGIHLTIPFMSMILDHHVTPRQLLAIYPYLYNDLKTYPISLCKTNECGIPSMMPYFLNPHIKETSPYGLNVSKSLSDYIETIDCELMDLYLKKACSTIGEALKRQRGDQYGFGDNPDSSELVTKNLTEKLMDDSDTAHTKPIENYFGNFDRELNKTGAQGFEKVSDDLIIKYSRDLIDEGYKWRTKENRKKASELKLLANEFNKKQKALIELGIDEEDAMKLTHENKILKCISMCKKLHGGPFTTADELEETVSSWSGTEKALHTSLNYEIRLRKLTFTQVKADCALFKQKKLSIQEKKRNLNSLICTQLEFKTQADMLDLECAIKETVVDVQDDVEMVNEQPVQPKSPNCDDNESETDYLASDDIWPPTVGQFIYGLFEDGVFPGEVTMVAADRVTMEILVPTKVAKMNSSDESLWKRQSLNIKSDYTLHRSSILPFHPIMKINRYSTKRVIIYEVLNYDIAEIFF